ncbi:MAG: CRISPR-associated protein Csb2 [Hydrocarboniphaga sp.]|uniref:type I-G CRISPR-associated protein Csb2 n=1 Tax=Hydrocarboniphaga sp. TaxID=2033016 RepID=UPI00262527B5|nr:type I-U CRISPR-associated protein Csb2 [Hydrocarboniphaga sp.]MDB5967573.1 CRISPR-associated protein Csb2 [Hydrocarboniphaga sp.]
MLTLRLTFPWGRYYAHPWGLNPTRLREAEWPPSSWRLLRALTSGWFRANSGHAPTSELLSLLEKLGRELPDIAVGPVAFSQTVHWQPNFGAADKDARAAATYKRTRHENHFAATASPVVFCWKNLALDERQRSLLGDILPHVSYFGRAESLCNLELTDGDNFPGVGWCRPCLSNGEPIRRIAENCRDVFCPDPRNFQAADLWSRRSRRDGLDPSAAPPHLVEDLLAHQPLPDGGRWVSYEMSAGWPGRWVVRIAKSARPKASRSPAPRIAHYLRFSLQCRIPVPLKFTVPLADMFRERALAHHRSANSDSNSFALSGHNRPEDVEGEHQHAFYLPLGTDRVRSDSLNELHVWCPYGFTQAEVEALMRVHRLDWGSGKHPLKPVLMAIGNTVAEGCPISIGQNSSRIWRNSTPFVPPRYFYTGNLHGAKLKAKDSPEQQLVLCLRQAGINSTGEIRRLTPSGQAQKSTPPMSDWAIVRAPEGEEEISTGGVLTAVHVPSASAKTEKTRRIGLFFELTFDAPVAFPTPALGHSCHYGLGLFVPWNI